MRERILRGSGGSGAGADTAGKRRFGCGSGCCGGTVVWAWKRILREVAVWVWGGIAGGCCGAALRRAEVVPGADVGAGCAHLPGFNFGCFYKYSKFFLIVKCGCR